MIDLDALANLAERLCDTQPLRSTVNGKTDYASITAYVRDAYEIRHEAADALRNIIDMARRAVVPSEKTEPRPKLLVWTDDVAAPTPFGTYTINEDSDDKWHFTYHEYPYGVEDDVAYDTVEEAKAAAQADYEARVLSALDQGEAK